MALTFPEMKAKTKVQIIGIVNQFNVYVQPETKKEYHSVDLLVAGHKNLLNIRLPEEYDRSKLEEGSLGLFDVNISEFKGRTNLDAIPAK